MSSEAIFSGDALSPFLRVLNATAWRYVQRQAGYIIELLRWPFFPILYFVALYLTYTASERETVSGYPVGGFLVVGVLGIVLWTSNLWSSGYAIEFERREGTLQSLYLTTGSRSAVVFGYGLGSLLVLVLPTAIVLGAIVLILGVEFRIGSVPSVILSFAGLLLASTALGYVLAGIFVLTRRANVIANFLQAPVYLLSGAVVPAAELPGSLQHFARVFPLSYGMDAVRNSMLAGATVNEIATSLLGLVGTSIALLALGAWLLQKVERNARNGAEIDFE